MARVRRAWDLTRRLVVRQQHAAAILGGLCLVVWGIADFSTILARVLAGALVIGLFGIEFGRRG